MKKLVLLIGLLFSSSLLASNCSWPEWEAFKRVYMQNGRIVDGSDARLITTSEGQSYALFFALAANDKQAFEQLLLWTEKHLAKGDLTARLPAWLWGKNEYGSYSILDSNPATDSDLWIAYTLNEAGVQWNNFYYRSLAYHMASRILREESTSIAGFGELLLPAPSGFDLEEDSYRVNPSYLPLQILARLADTYPEHKWHSIYQTSVKQLIETAPKGYSPDWAVWKNGNYQADQDSGAVGSYSAIRTYLWAGMLDDRVAEKQILLDRLQPMVSAVQQLGYPPRHIDTLSGKYTEEGSSGFSAALLPFIAAHKHEELLDSQAIRAKDSGYFDANNRYYDSVLSLFGLGWLDERFRFGPKGEFVPSWSEECRGE